MTSKVQEALARREKMAQLPQQFSRQVQEAIYAELVDGGVSRKLAESWEQPFNGSYPKISVHIFCNDGPADPRPVTYKLRFDVGTPLYDENGEQRGDIAVAKRLINRLGKFTYHYNGGLLGGTDLYSRDFKNLDEISRLLKGKLSKTNGGNIPLGDAIGRV